MKNYLSIKHKTIIACLFLSIVGMNAFGACTSTGKFEWTVNPNSGYTVSESYWATNVNPWLLWTVETPSVSLLFNAFRTYTITQTFANSCGQSTVNQTVVVGCGGQTFSIQPLSSQTICQNVQAEQITAVAAGASNVLTYQWYNNTVNSNNGGIAIIGATSSTYTPMDNSLGSHYYYCVVTDTGNGVSVVSTVSNVNVVSTPIVNLPADVTSCIPALHNFSPSINTNGDNVVPFIYDAAFNFSEGLALVYKDKNYFFINKHGGCELLCR